MRAQTRSRAILTTQSCCISTIKRAAGRALYECAAVARTHAPAPKQSVKAATAMSEAERQSAGVAGRNESYIKLAGTDDRAPQRR